MLPVKCYSEGDLDLADIDECVSEAWGDENDFKDLFLDFEKI